VKQELDVAAHQGKEKFAETLAKEAREKGHMAPEYEFYATLLQGPVRQVSWEPKIPYGSAIVALWAGLDICLDCGTMFGLKLIKGIAKKPATMPEEKKPPPGSPLYRGLG